MNKILNHLFNKFLFIIENHNRIKVSDKSFIHPHAILKGVRISGNVIIADGCKISNGVTIDAGSTVTIGRYTSLNGPNMDIKSLINPVNIGSFCSIARNVSIQEFNHNYDNLTTYHINQNLFKSGRLKDVHSKGSIDIGNDVWIGTQCVISSGAKIGSGAIIAANSFVIGEIPPFAIAGGSPAKILKYRFDDKTIQRIQDLNWWNWSIEKIKSNKYLFENNYFKL
jgi:virginiamycin A acetyltransferase